MLIAQAVTGYSIVQLIIIAIVVAACVGILFVALKQFGIQIPAFVIQIFWIVVAAVIAIFAIKLVISMW